MKSDYKHKNIFRIKDQIFKLAPEVNDVDVKVSKIDNGEFESLIRVHIPPRKKLFVAKKDEDLAMSLEKSRQAILRQVKKVKNKKSRKRYRGLHLYDEAV